MKVLFVATLSHHAEDRDVLARRQIPLFQSLVARGIDLTVVLFGDGADLGSELRAAGIATRVLQPHLPPAMAGIGALLPAIVRLRPLIRDLSPQIIEGDEPLPAIVASIAALGTKSVRIYRRHHHHGRRGLYAASRLAAKLSNWTVVSNEVMAAHAAAVDRTPMGQILVATSGTLYPQAEVREKTQEIRKSLGIPQEARIVGVVSRLRQQKGIDLLIRSLSLLSYAGPVHCFIAGSGPEERNLKRIASSSTIPVHFVGHQDNVDEWIYAADVVVMPSRSEAFGRLTLEAMACGRPLIAARVGGLKEAIVDDVTGLLVEPECEEALARAVDTLLGDDERRIRMGSAARERWEANYTIDRMADAWVQTWTRSLLEQR
jgi:hypothetical protein